MPKKAILTQEQINEIHQQYLHKMSLLPIIKHKRTTHGAGYKTSIRNHPDNSRNPQNFKAFECWNNMIMFTYSAAYMRRLPACAPRIVVNDWLHFETFLHWYRENYKPGYLLNQNIVGGPGNHIYGPDTCRFMPSRVINLIRDRDRNTKPRNLPKGVSSYGDNAYRSYINKHVPIYQPSTKEMGKMTNQDFADVMAEPQTKLQTVHIGTYETPEEASEAYKSAKADEIRTIAMEEHKIHRIDTATLDALLSVADTYQPQPVSFL